MNELEVLKTNASKVYSEITQGLITNTDYSSDDVLGVVRNLQDIKKKSDNVKVYWDIKTILKNMYGDLYTEDADEILKEYFKIGGQE